MTSTTDRLLADLIAHFRWSYAYQMGASEGLLAAYAAERLALAEQQLSSAPTGMVHTWVNMPGEGVRCSDCGVYRTRHALDDSRCPGSGNGAPPAETPATDWIEEARKRAHEMVEDHIGSFAPFMPAPEKVANCALDAFIAAMPPYPDVGAIWNEARKQVAAEAKPSQGPQPEEVPEDVIYEVSDIFWKSGRAADKLSEITNYIWNAARRHAPMPSRVTDEMVDAAVWAACASDPGRSFASTTMRRALEAALSASKD